MPTSADEAKDLFETLAFAAGVVQLSDAAHRARICAAYDEGRQLIARIAPPGTPPRPGIVACIARFDAHKEAGDVAAAGWVLAAIAARVAQRDLKNWEFLQIIIDRASDMLAVHSDRKPH